MIMLTPSQVQEIDFVKTYGRHRKIRFAPECKVMSMPAPKDLKHVFVRQERVRIRIRREEIAAQKALVAAEREQKREIKCTQGMVRQIATQRPRARQERSDASTPTVVEQPIVLKSILLRRSSTASSKSSSSSASSTFSSSSLLSAATTAPPVLCIAIIETHSAPPHDRAILRITRSPAESRTAQTMQPAVQSCKAMCKTLQAVKAQRCREYVDQIRQAYASIFQDEDGQCYDDGPNEAGKRTLDYLLGPKYCRLPPPRTPLQQTQSWFSRLRSVTV
ncbi:uncharacterized protein L969DRAFT_139089 [Mixia osmundae IAM 14324]|nr:uncharacterized protein L969DRAFT_139089 [Mixia osmundae IAM 14324]KEI42242.1 hypothetical protein L969DRAFT_139089 [Mixia osmundae IAM 14324]